MAKLYKDDNPVESFLQEMAASIKSKGKMPICEFAKEVVFNGSDDFKLFPTQRAILKAYYNEPLSEEEEAILNGWKEEDRTSWVPDRNYIALVIEAGRRASKAISLDSLIATPDGYKKYENIHPGDYVFTPKGTPTKVIAETEVFVDRKCYRLHFHNGETIECSADHEWKTWDKSSRKSHRRAKNPTKHPFVKTTQEIADTLYVERKDGKLENNHSIELTQPLNYKEQNLLIHPYCLGLYLGDGFYKTGMITSSKEDINFVRNKFKSLGYDTELVSSNYPYRFKSQRLIKELKELNILNNKNKYIPENYLIGSVSQRLELLRGLMDSDGHVDKKGKAYFTNTNFYLSDLVYKLALSLGCVASKTFNTGSYKNIEGEDVICKDYVQVSLRPNLTPVSLPRKVKRYKPCTNQNNKWFIVKAEEIDPVPVKCITVEDEDHLFLVGEELIPTHNCNAEFATIYTTVGLITYKELHERLSSGEKIGIQTYDLETSKVYTTYDIKTEINQHEEVFEVVTSQGKREITNKNHPYLKWYDDTTTTNWVELRQLRPGNRIAVSDYINLWGSIEATSSELNYYALILGLARKGSKYISPHNTKKEIRKILKNYDTLIFNNGFLHLKEGLAIEDLLDTNIINNLTKKSTINLLVKFCRFCYKFETNCNYLSFRCKNVYSTLIQNLFQKLGIYTESTPYGIKIPKANSLHKLVDTLGWNITNDEIELREYFGTRNLFSPSPSEKSEDALNLKNIHFEKIIKIKSLGKATTIALEVKKTHVISNQIVSHNSTMSSIICLKEFYDLITLEDPAKYYGMITKSPISILVLAQSKAQVKDTIFAAIKGYAEGSIFFRSLEKQGKIQILSEEIRCPEKNVAIYAKHTRTEALVGYTIKCLILDEVARFQSVGEDGRNKAFEIWKNVATGGAGFQQHFKKIAISSAWEPGDPIEVMYEEGKKDPLTLGFKLTTFQINLKLVKGVSPTVISDYTIDFVKARREYEGIRFNKFNSFIDKKRLEKACTSTSCLDATPIPIDVGEGEKIRKYAGIHINRLATQSNTEELSFIHIDPALKKDSAGLAIATPITTEEGWKIRLDGFVKWEPHTDNNGNRRIVSFLNIENILDKLIEKRNIFRVTFDQYNSESFIQKLHSIGVDSEQVSCTREAQFSYYMLFRDLLNHNYIILPKDSLWTGDVVTELSELVLKPNRQIIHPYAAKDLADAVVNAVFQAHQYMIRSGMQMNYGMGASVAQGSILPKVTLTNTTNLKIGTARDKLYKNLLK